MTLLQLTKEITSQDEARALLLQFDPEIIARAVEATFQLEAGPNFASLKSRAENGFSIQVERNDDSTISVTGQPMTPGRLSLPNPSLVNTTKPQNSLEIGRAHV